MLSFFSDPYCIDVSLYYISYLKPVPVWLSGWFLPLEQVLFVSIQAPTIRYAYRLHLRYDFSIFPLIVTPLIGSAPRFHVRTQPVSVLYQRHRGQHGINSPSLCWWHHCLLGSILHPRCRNPTEQSEQAWNLGKKMAHGIPPWEMPSPQITRKRKPIVYNYTLLGHTLEHVKTAKCLGITMTKDSQWNTHIENITSKANQTLRFLRRKVQINCPWIKTAAYQTLVWTLLEYMLRQCGTHIPKLTSRK